MKTQLILLATGLVLSTAVATAANALPAADRWLEESRAILEARVVEAGLADDGKAVSIRITATADGKRYAPKIVHSSGSADYDLAVRDSLKGVKLPAPPVELNGRGVTFTLGQPDAGAATGSN